jgi:hypothetical protein
VNSQECFLILVTQDALWLACRRLLTTLPRSFANANDHLGSGYRSSLLFWQSSVFTPYWTGRHAIM